MRMAINLMIGVVLEIVDHGHVEDQSSLVSNPDQLVGCEFCKVEVLAAVPELRFEIDDKSAHEMKKLKRNPETLALLLIRGILPRCSITVVVSACSHRDSSKLEHECILAVEETSTFSIGLSVHEEEACRVVCWVPCVFDASRPHLSTSIIQSTLPDRFSQLIREIQ